MVGIGGVHDPDTRDLCCHTTNHAKALRRHVTEQMFQMKQSTESDGVYDPNLIALLDSIPNNDEEDPKVKGIPKKA